MTDAGRQWRGIGIKSIIPRIMKFKYRYLRGGFVITDEITIA